MFKLSHQTSIDSTQTHYVYWTQEALVNVTKEPILKIINCIDIYSQTNLIMSHIFLMSFFCSGRFDIMMTFCINFNLISRKTFANFLTKIFCDALLLVQIVFFALLPSENNRKCLEGWRVTETSYAPISNLDYWDHFT